MNRFTDCRALFAGLAALLLSACSTVSELPAPDRPVSLPDEEVVPGFEGPVPPDAKLLQRFDEAVAAMKAEDFTTARDLLQQINENNGNLASVLVNLGISRLRLDDRDGAESAFRQALRLQPGYPVAVNQLGVMARTDGRFGDARAWYQQGLERAPDYAPLHYNMGILCDLFLREAQCALSHYARYVELEGNDAENVKLWLVDLERRSGHTSE